jgi:hypothetical protein
LICKEIETERLADIWLGGRLDRGNNLKEENSEERHFHMNNLQFFGQQV